MYIWAKTRVRQSEFINCVYEVSRCDSWWRRQMKTFSALLALCEWNPPITGDFPSHRPVTRSFDILFDLRLNKRLHKQSRRWWFETPSCSFWRHCNESFVALRSTNRTVIYLGGMCDSIYRFRSTLMFCVVGTQKTLVECKNWLSLEIVYGPRILSSWMRELTHYLRDQFCGSFVGTPFKIID